MRIGSVEVQEVTGTVREIGNTIDIWSDGVSQLLYDHDRFFGVALQAIDHSHISIKVNVKFVYYTAIVMPAPSIFKRLRIPPYK